MDDKHILISLGDDKVKQIGEVIGNKTCNKILDLLAGEEMTVTDISKKLKIPLNTTDYNIKKLVKSGLIEKTSHFWSTKGKKMPVYKVSNRKIIISPKRTIGKIFLWAFGITGLAALTVRQFTKNILGISKPITRTVEDLVFEEATLAIAIEPQTEAIAAGIADTALGAVSQSGFWSTINPWAWFLFGAWFAIFLFFALTLFNERRGKK